MRKREGKLIKKDLSKEVALEAGEGILGRGQERSVCSKVREASRAGLQLEKG